MFSWQNVYAGPPEKNVAQIGPDKKSSWQNVYAGPDKKSSWQNV